MDESYTGGDVIVQALKAAGVEYVFGIISIHNIPIYDAIAWQGGIRPITNRSEPGAVNMADRYAKASGRLGVVITSTGAGAGNAVGALIEAQTHGTPLLHLTGQIDFPYLDQDKGFIHECKDQQRRFPGALNTFIGPNHPARYRAGSDSTDRGSKR